MSDGGRPLVGGRFRQPDRTPFFRLTPSFGLRTDTFRRRGAAEVLKKSKVNGKLPKFLKLNPVNVLFFPEEETKSLTQKYQQVLDERQQQKCWTTLYRKRVTRREIMQQS